MEISAAEARITAREVNTSTSSGQMVEIMSVISDACKKGEYSVDYYNPIHADAKNKLIELGYSVKPQMGRNESWTLISW